MIVNENVGNSQDTTHSVTPVAVWGAMEGDDWISGALAAGQGLAGDSGEWLFRSASILKPLLAWISFDAYQSHGKVFEWMRDAAAAILVSENRGAQDMWDATGGTETVLQVIADRTGVTFLTDGSEHRDPVAFPFGRVLVSAHTLALAYVALVHAAERERPAGLVLDWMRSTLPSQRFQATPRFSRDPVKAGWSTAVDETLLRTHAVRVGIGANGDRRVGVALTALPFSHSSKSDYIQRCERGEDVFDVNMAVAGSLIQAGMSLAFP